MTDQEQQRADHLALVAAPIYASLSVSIVGWIIGDERSLAAALEEAADLQRAAEQRVKR